MTLSYATIISDAPDWVDDESDEYAAALPNLLKRAQDRCYDAIPELQQLITSTTGNLVAGSATLSRPSDALFFRSMEITVSGAQVLLERRDRAVLVEMYPTTTQGTPRYYAESGASQIRVAPTPDSTYAYTIFYGRKLAYLTSDSGTNWLTDYAPNLLQYAVEVESYRWKHDGESEREALGAFGRSVNDVRKRHGLNERDDYRALYAPVSVDNQGDSPVPVGARMKAMQGGEQNG